MQFLKNALFLNNHIFYEKNNIYEVGFKKVTKLLPYNAKKGIVKQIYQPNKYLQFFF